MKRCIIMAIVIMAATMLVGCGGDVTPPTLSDPNGIILEENVIEENILEEIQVNEIKVNEIKVNEIKVDEIKIK